MIYPPLYILSEKLSEHLQLALNLKDDLVRLGPPPGQNASPPNKLSISLVSIERESAGGIKFSGQAVSGDQFRKTAPTWQLNVYVMIAALFSEKQYADGLQILSQALSFIQNNNTITLDGTSTTFSIEPVNMSISELSNIWSISGGTYFPSIICKIRGLNISSNEIKKLSVPIMKKDTGV